MPRAIDSIKKRQDFLALRNRRGYHAGGFLLLALARGKDSSVARAVGDQPRLGLTVTKKLGNAVRRNRIKRKLREAARLEASHCLAGYDYVAIAFQGAFDQPVADMRRHFAKGFAIAPRRGLEQKSPSRRRA